MEFLSYTGMGKKKVALVSKAQLRQASLLHASSKTAEASKPLALEKGLGNQVSRPCRGQSHRCPLCVLPLNMSHQGSLFDCNSVSVDTSVRFWSLVFKVCCFYGTVVWLFCFVVEVVEKDAPCEEEEVVILPLPVEVLARPHKVNKRKGVVVPASSRQVRDAYDGVVDDAAQRFVRWKLRRTEPATSAFSVEVPTSLDGLDSRFFLDILATAHVKGQNEDFNRIGVDPCRAFDRTPNIVNSESILFDDSDVGSHMVEVMALLCDRHAMCHSEETTAEFAEKLYGTLGLVSLFS